MFFRHSAVLWKFENLPAGQHVSPTLRHVNPNYDDSDQEFLALFEFTNTEADGTVFGFVEVGGDGVFIPTLPASDGETGGVPDPFVGVGPHTGVVPLLPGFDDGGGGGGPGFLPIRTFSFVGPLTRVQLVVGDGAQPNQCSGKFVLISNGPIALRPEAP